ncbi:hypothetical protein [Variovorax ginsengisoli]|uniref:N-acetyltransferase domain-containing protein n=1 Tax=Variovorax ginsengisoli TaxID=363844 RepID=A0ABT8SDN4_9BURK|nr:hypothetical protein [Variovorax ginsengisoli]MDN8617127.1 hypothetical protein [Variovorax ginsengisoli]MDO1536297.1 hypothetical protein [Variovorax ginsengisoli]
MDCTTKPEADLDLYFAWLARFEASIPQAQDVVSRWYTSAALQAYMRYSWFKASTPGEPALCLAHIQVAKDARGQGYFARLVDRFLEGSDGLQARVLYLENIASPRFEGWLLRVGFQRCTHSSDQFSAYYVTR